MYSLTCFKFKSQFQIQSKHDHGVKSHKCSECDYASSQADVVSHVIAHSGEKSQKFSSTNIYLGQDFEMPNIDRAQDTHVVRHRTFLWSQH